MLVCGRSLAGKSLSPTRPRGTGPPASLPRVVSAGIATSCAGLSNAGTYSIHRTRFGLTVPTRLLNNFVKDNNDEVRASGRHFAGI